MFRFYERRKVLIAVSVLILVVYTAAYGMGIQESDEAIGSAQTTASSPILEYLQDVENPEAWKFFDRSGILFLEDGNKTTVPLKQYEKIVITSAGAVEILYMIGGESRIAAIGTSRSGIWPEDKTAELPSVGGLSRPNLEAILSFEPDLFIANGMNTELVSDLNGRGIPSIIHSTDTITEIMNAVLILGVLTGREDSAIALVSERNAVLDEIRMELAKNPLGIKGAFLYSIEPIQAFTDDSLPGQILDILGVTNIASGLTTKRPILTSEYLLVENPDFLLGAMSIENEDQIMTADSVVSKTRAGAEKNIWIVPSHMILRPTPRIIDALSLLHERLSELAARD